MLIWQRKKVEHHSCVKSVLELCVLVAVASIIGRTLRMFLLTWNVTQLYHVGEKPVTVVDSDVANQCGQSVTGSMEVVVFVSSLLSLVWFHSRIEVVWCRWQVCSSIGGQRWVNVLTVGPLWVLKFYRGVRNRWRWMECFVDPNSAPYRRKKHIYGRCRKHALMSTEQRQSCNKIIVFEARWF